jgi:hypothetical protein
MGHVLEFLDLRWTPAFESGFRRYHFDPARKEAYRTDLGIHDVALLDAALCPLLRRYAYVEPQRRKTEGSSPAVEGG